MELSKNQEAIGILENLQNIDQKCVLTFAMRTKVEIPKEKIPSKNIQELLGKKVGILKLGDRLFLREIKEG